MNTAPLVIERIFDAPISKVWEAISDNDSLKQWYFQLKEFKPEVGFEFRFLGGSKEQQYLHICEITEVIPGKKLSYSWRYDNYPGSSLVTFELSAESDKTKLTLTHEGTETFAQDNKDFARESFSKGWTHIIHTSLKNFLEPK